MNVNDREKNSFIFLLNKIYKGGQNGEVVLAVRPQVSLPKSLVELRQVWYRWMQ